MVVGVTYVYSAFFIHNLFSLNPVGQNYLLNDSIYPVLSQETPEGESGMPSRTRTFKLFEIKLKAS